MRSINQIIKTLLNMLILATVSAGLPGCSSTGKPIYPTEQGVVTKIATETQTSTEIPPSTPSLVPPTSIATQTTVTAFDGKAALDAARYQLSLGPRVVGSKAHDQVVAWIVQQLSEVGWNTELQEGELLGHPIKNIIAKRGKGTPWIIIGAHYDSRMIADHDEDPQKAKEPVPGANDGASGVGVLLELARVLPNDLSKQVWLVFFDTEDNGNIMGWDWILGSRYFVSQLASKPDAAIIIDMIGDADLQIYQERNSDTDLTKAIWLQAEQLGYTQFKPSVKFSILDDHTPFLNAGIPAIDIIDFNYPYYHTSQDTIDKISSESLAAVGETLRAWLTTSSLQPTPAK